MDVGRAARMMLVAMALLAVAAAPAAAEPAGSVALREQMTRLDSGDGHTCAILASGGLRCWGANDRGQLGLPGSPPVGDDEAAGAAPELDLGARRARAVVAGSEHTCALLDDGAVRCWGSGEFGQTGHGTTENVDAPLARPPVDLGAGRRAVALTAGSWHTCALLDDAGVRCWGRNDFGQLGQGNTSPVGDNEKPADVPPLALPGPVRLVAAGDLHTCAVLDDVSLRCWGQGGSGQLGYGSTADIGNDEPPGAGGPVPLGAGRTVRAIALGSAHTCALLDDATVRCWGYGVMGQTGHGSPTITGTSGTAADTPVLNFGAGRTVVAITAGSSHSCAIVDTGELQCFGEAAFGVNGQQGAQSYAPAPVASGGQAVKAVSGGRLFTCALLADGTLRCFGRNNAGQLGYGTSPEDVGDNEAPDSPGPVPLPGKLATAVADVAVTLALESGRVAVGGTVGLVATVTNAGPEAANGLSVDFALPPTLAPARRAAVAVVDVPPGGSATVGMLVRGVSTGVAAPVAELATAGTIDPDSTPLNRLAEDDLASAVITVVPPGAGGGPGGASPGGGSGGPGGGTASGGRLTLRATPRRDRRAPFRFTASGELTGAPCRGNVQVRLLAGRRILLRRATALRTRRGRCRYSVRLSLRRRPAARRLTLTARLGATDVRARNVTVRVR